MRDGTESGEENNENSSEGNWSKSDNMPDKNKFGNHRRGTTTNAGPLKVGPTKSTSGDGWGKQNREYNNARVPYGSNSNRDSTQNTANTNYTRMPSRSHPQEGFRCVLKLCTMLKIN